MSGASVHCENPRQGLWKQNCQVQEVLVLPLFRSRGRSLFFSYRNISHIRLPETMELPCWPRLGLSYAVWQLWIKVYRPFIVLSRRAIPLFLCWSRCNLWYKTTLSRVWKDEENSIHQKKDVIMFEYHFDKALQALISLSSGRFVISHSHGRQNSWQTMHLSVWCI